MKEKLAVMDGMLVDNFTSILTKLQTANDSGSTLPQDKFMGCILTFIRATDKINSERFSRLQSITLTDYPVLLAYRSSAFWQVVENEAVDKSVSFVTYRKSSKHSSSSTCTDKSNVTGSPMKLDIIADLSVLEGEGDVFAGKAKSLDCGLPLGLARKLASIYCNSFNNVKNGSLTEQHAEIPNLVVLCDGNNLKSVSCLCVVPIIDKQNNFLGVKMSEVINKPAVEKSKVPKSLPVFSNAEVNCFAKYDIMSCLDDKMISDFQNSLKLELHWRKLAGQSLILLHDPPADAVSVVKIQVTSGSTRSPAFGVYEELEILRSVITGLATTEVNWIGTQERPLVEATKDLVEQLKLGSDTIEYTAGDTSGEDESHSPDLLLLEERKDLDFTDHLWRILQNCTSYSELIDTFQYIVKVLRQGDLQPFIHKHNNTTIAQMVKDSYRGQLRTPSMTGLSPLMYLAEIGIQKLTHDYIHVFMSRNLTTLGYLEYFIKTNLELEERLERLFKLHNVFEVVILLKQCLDLPQMTLGDSTRQMLKHYEHHDINSSHHFLFTVPTSALSKIIERNPPCEWKAEGSKVIESVLERSMYHFASDQLFDWVVLPVNGRDKESSRDGAEMSYFLTQLNDSVSVLS